MNDQNEIEKINLFFLIVFVIIMLVCFKVTALYEEHLENINQLKKANQGSGYKINRIKNKILK